MDDLIIKGNGNVSSGSAPSNTLHFYDPLKNLGIYNGIQLGIKLGVGMTNPSERISVGDGFRETACLKADGAIEIVDDLTLEEARRTIHQMLEAWRDVVSTP